MKTAVIKTGGKQYLVQEGDKVRIEKLPAKVGDKTTFKEVLLSATDKTAKIGTPLVKGVEVQGKVTEQARHKKIMGVKMKSKKRYRHLFGHKQHYTEVEITSIKTK